MKATVMLFAISAALLFGTSLSADTMQDQLNGTWSGSWTINGVRDAMTIEIKHDDNGRLTGRFVTPKSIAFTKVTVDSKTHSILLEGTDFLSGKSYKLSAKVDGTEIKGIGTAGDESGPIDLIKWTFFPRVGGY